MSNKYNIVKSSPAPLKNGFTITQSTTITFFTSGGVLVIDRKTGKILRKGPEKPLPGEISHSISTAASLLFAITSMRGVKDLQVQATKFLLSVTKTIEKPEPLPWVILQKPDPLPWKYSFVLTQSTTIAVFVSGGVLLIDRKTGKIIKKIPEMAIHDEFLDSIVTIADLLLVTNDIKGNKEFQSQTAEFLICTVETMIAQLSTKNT